MPMPTPDLSEPHGAGNLWHPFGHRLEYEWAHYHYVQLQSSADSIQRSLDLWKATVMRHQTNNNSPGVPWKTAKEMYESIDSISVGRGGWTTYKLLYCGPRPDGIPPCSG
jgi:hypothetical protein